MYVGSTIRNLHDRVKEHMNGTTSSVYKHFLLCENTAKTLLLHIIGRNNDEINLRLREAFLIRQMQPTISSSKECSE